MTDSRVCWPLGRLKSKQSNKVCTFPGLHTHRDNSWDRGVARLRRQEEREERREKREERREKREERREKREERREKRSQKRPPEIPKLNDSRVFLAPGPPRVASFLQCKTLRGLIIRCKNAGILFRESSAEERSDDGAEKREKREERKWPPARFPAFLRCPVATSKKL